ncbi:SulP family inorganic anion transporter [Chitinilyticum aquatile]|uniref:SulP family inorganic anion transporter n=1 Tax=Chitinilyticum aquatile TaxID=362520 RepID=UPI0004169767|nr:SulP family inorganic anion transporter [Chitinilyticum aquatile]
MRAARWLPILHWLPGYDRQMAQGDLLASVIVALLLLPQGIAYALLAGLPAEAGLYAGILPLVIYALLGSSMTQSVGPMAVTSAMTFAALSPLAASGSAEWINHAILLTLLTGAWLWLLAAARLDQLLRLVSAPVLQGFADGVALLIVLGQLSPLLGIAFKGDTLQQLLPGLLQGLGHLDMLLAGFGVAGLVLLALAAQPFARLLQRAGLPPARAQLAGRITPLLVLLLATAVLAAHPVDGIRLLGLLPAGLPALQLPALPAQPEKIILVLLWPALGIALAGYLQSISVARQMAARQGRQINSRQELLALGSCNLGAALCGGMPVSGGFSRTAVNAAAGARTPLAGLFTAGWLLLILLFLTPALATLPLAWLAATIILAASRLMAPGYLLRLLRAGRAGWHEALPYLATLVAVLFSGAVSGILTGVVLSLLLVLQRASRPHIAILGRVPGSEHFRNIERFTVETWPELLIIRIDESLFFANIEAVLLGIENALRAKPQAQHLLLSLAAVNHIDLSAADELLRWHGDLARRGITLSIAELKGPVRGELAGHGWLAALAGQDYLSAHEAVNRLQGNGA